MKEKLASIFGLICIVTVIFTLFNKGFADQESTSGNPPTFDEIREHIIKGEARSHSRLSHLLSTSSAQRNYDVTYYRLDIAIDENAETVGGDVLMVGRSLLDSLSMVEIDLYDNMQVDSVKSSGQLLGFTHSNDVLSATLSAVVNMDELFMVRIFYSGTPQSVGWGSFGFNTHGVNNDPIIWSLSEPDAARTWWPCNDDPSDKADSVDIYLTVSDDLVASSQGTLESVIDNGDGTKTFYWKEHYPITTYLVSVAISNYETISDLYVSSSGDSMLVIHYVYPESYGDALEDFNVTVPMIEAFVEIFGEYPFLQEKYAHSEFPWGGAMEHQTNCTYGTGLITGNHRYDMVVAHELTHQWWGDMITCETWEDIWLNEGFASYGEALWAEHLGGFNDYRAYMIDLDRYFNGGNFSGPIYDPTQLFGSTVYNKGAWALHMLRHVLGDSTFFQALWDYGHDPDLVFGTATTAELQGVLETSSGVDLGWFFQEWVYGSNRPNYEYWWGSEPSGNDYQLTVSVDQVQTNAPVFRMPVDIQVVTASGESTFTVIDSLEVQEFVFMLPEEPQEVYIDRYNWILKHVSMVPPVGVGDDKTGIQLPRSLALHQNYPNPFNPSTVISYDIPVDLDGMELNLVIYDIRGRNVRGLKSGPARGGKNEVTWDGRDDRGRPVGSGLYLYRLEINGRIEMKRMVLLK